MGLLSKGTPLDWQHSLPHHAYVKYHGILQFLAVYAAQKGRSDDTFLWGDEVEHLILQINATPNNQKSKRAQLSLRAAELIEALEAIPAEQRHANFLPEYGRFMIEATPAAPYGGYTADLRQVEINMRERRRLIEALLKPNERLITLTGFPLMGVTGFSETGPEPSQQIQGPVADSDYVMDQIIGAHPRFATLSRNIRTRRGARVDIRVPLFQDKNTARDVAAANAAEQAILDKLAEARAANPSALPHPPRPADLDQTKQIHMDAMAFGMGMACLQVTFQTRSLDEARHLYDHLAVLSPIMLALTAASPFYRGRIADIDSRWTVISQSVDDRTRVERAEAKTPEGLDAEERNICGAGPYQSPSSSSSSVPCSDSSLPQRKPQHLYKSRYDSISTYLSTQSDFKPEYNDLPCEIDEPSYRLLQENGIDELLSRHIAHLFTRDPLVIYDEHIQLNDQESSDHFENIQSTNWQTVRFKPPTPGSKIGWRVEFRTMEVQLTDFENAAFTVFIALVSRALLYFKLNFYIPLSKVDVNLKRAHTRDGVTQEKFYWRKNLKVCNSSSSSSSSAAASASSASSAPSATSDAQDEYEEMSIRDIMLGSSGAINGEAQPGLINLVRTYLDMIECDEATRRIVDTYLDLIGKRASGELLTCASWLRKFVNVHPAYEHNSLLNDEIVYDIVVTCDQIVKGTLQVPQLLGQYSNLPRAHEETSESKKLRGAEGCSASSASSSSASVAASPSGRVLDLTVIDCCEKMRRHLAGYLAQTSHSSGPSSPTSASRVASAAAAAETAASSSVASNPSSSPTETAHIPWVSPTPN